MENDFLKVIETRRSCRKYKPEQITDEELRKPYSKPVLMRRPHAVCSRPTLWQCRRRKCLPGWQK